MKRALSFLTIFTMIFMATGCVEDDPIQPGPPPYPPTGSNPPVNSNVINKNINSKTVLKNHQSGVDYEICGTVYVNAELIIEAGTEIVMCSGARLYVEKDGSLNAIGTEASPIVIRGKAASPGYWDLIRISANNPSNVMEYVTLSDGGGYNYYSNTTVHVNKGNSGQLTMKNSKIKNSKGYGLTVEGGATIPNFSNNTFSNNGDAPVQIAFSILGALDDSSNFSDGNANNYIDVKASTINQAQEVKSLDVPYLLNGTNYIKNGLKLEAGVEILMAAGTRVYVESSGSFNAIGTNAKPIEIKGKVNTHGYWDLIRFESNNPLNEFKYVNIQDGGAYSYYYYSSIYVSKSNNASFIMNDCNISDSYGWGLYADKGASMTPSTEAAVRSANTFNNNGNGVNASCTGSCDVYVGQ